MLERIRIFQEAIIESIETEIQYDEAPLLHLGIEHDFYSCYWESPMRASQFILFARELVPLEVNCRMYTKSRPENAIYKFQEVVDEKITDPLKLDQECLFLRIYGFTFDLTWHVEIQSPELIIIGLISDKLNTTLLRKVFEYSTGKEIPEEGLVVIEKLLGKF